MLTLAEMNEIVNDVKCQDYKFQVEDHDDDGFLVQMITRPERKWYVSKHSTETEVVNTLFDAVECYKRHELKETFLYKDVAVFAFDLNVDDLVWCTNNEEIDLDTREGEG